MDRRATARTATAAASTPSAANRAVPALLTFDAPSREICTVRRIRTNTPLQALTTLNDPAFFEAAQAWPRASCGKAARARAREPTYGFRLCVARRPKAAEVDRIVAAFDKERTWFDGHRDEAARRGAAARRTARSWPPGPWSPTCCSIWTRRSPRSNGVNRQELIEITRRQFFTAGTFGIGGDRAGRRCSSRDGAGRSRIRWRRTPPHFAPKAKRVIYLFMAGAPSQLDLFDYKPKLQRAQRPAVPGGTDQGRALRVHQGHAHAARLAAQVRAHGQSGAELSDLLPHLAAVADDVAIVKSMHTDAVQSRAGADLHEHRPPVSAGRAWARG